MADPNLSIISQSMFDCGTLPLQLAIVLPSANSISDNMLPPVLSTVHQQQKAKLLIEFSSPSNPCFRFGVLACTSSDASRGSALQMIQEAQLVASNPIPRSSAQVYDLKISSNQEHPNTPYDTSKPGGVALLLTGFKSLVLTAFEEEMAGVPIRTEFALVEKEN
ncbi:hypothetical protein BDR03DRAFT_1086505 [Suillus americanus]|nr:hypothetical protein BDR03DRAFT_1086505 [Suillus americanus]